jgi:hypothetical protein
MRVHPVESYFAVTNIIFKYLNLVQLQLQRYILCKYTNSVSVLHKKQTKRSDIFGLENLSLPLSDATSLEGKISWRLANPSFPRRLSDLEIMDIN